MAAILNPRGRFAAAMWAPVLNNVMVIASGLTVLGMPRGPLVGGQHCLSAFLRVAERLRVREVRGLFGS